MAEPANGQERKPIRTPDWARNPSKMNAVKTCDVLKRSVWCGCDACGRRVLNAFIYEVSDQDGICNTGLMVVCSCMTLYLLLNGSTTTYPDLEQICLPPCGFNDEGVMEGDGGAVQWTDKSFQEVQHYVCVMMSGDDQCSVDQPGDVCDFSRSRLAELLAAELSGGSAAGGCPEGKADARRREADGGAVDEAGWRGAGVTVGWQGGDVTVGRGQAEEGEDAGSLQPEKCYRGCLSQSHGEHGGGDVEISPDYKLIRIGMIKIDLSRKPKARSFLRFVREHLNGETREFRSEEMRDAFNAQFGEMLKHKGWSSDRLREDLFKGLGKGDFDLLFDTVNLPAGIYRLKI